MGIEPAFTIMGCILEPVSYRGLFTSVADCQLKLLICSEQYHTLYGSSMAGVIIHEALNQEF